MTIHMQGKIEVVLRLIKTTFSDIWIKPTIVAQHLVIEMSVHKNRRGSSSTHDYLVCEKMTIFISYYLSLTWAYLVNMVWNAVKLS